MPLKRKQIYLDSGNERKIQKLSKATGLSEAEHIRRAVAAYVAKVSEQSSNRNPLLNMIGICDSKSGPTDAAVRHDKYLYGRKR